MHRENNLLLCKPLMRSATKTTHGHSYPCRDFSLEKIVQNELFK